MSCHCLCFASHAERGICDAEAPHAFVAVSIEGSALAEFEDGDERTIIMCQPCGEAAVATNPRARTMVLVGGLYD